jgi:hypothetical protein
MDGQLNYRRGLSHQNYQLVQHSETRQRVQLLRKKFYRSCILPSFIGPCCLATTCASKNDGIRGQVVGRKFHTILKGLLKPPSYSPVRRSIISSFGQINHILFRPSDRAGNVYLWRLPARGVRVSGGLRISSGFRTSSPVMLQC